jgi:hypothetical protein
VEISLASLEVSAVNSQVVGFAVWDYIIDNDFDGQPDDGQTYLWCERVLERSPLPPIPISYISPTTLPWTFSVSITAIPAGTSERIAITSDDARNEQYNVALYDEDTVIPGGATPPLPPRFTNGTPPDAVDRVVTIGTENYRFVQFTERINPSVNYDVMHAVTNPLVDAMGFDPAVLGEGTCSVGNPGDPRIDDIIMPYTFSLNKGDTVIFEARLGDTPPAGTGLSAVTAPPGLPPTALRVNMTVDGRDVNVQGVSSGDAISFSYTVR